MALKCVSSLPFAQVQANHHSKNLPCEPTSLQPSHLAEHVNVCSSTAIWPWVREEEVDCCSFDNCVTLRYLGCKHADSVCRHLLIYPQLTSSIFTRLSSMIDGQPQCRRGCHNVTAQSVTPSSSCGTSWMGVRLAAWLSAAVCSLGLCVATAHYCISRTNTVTSAAATPADQQQLRQGQLQRNWMRACCASQLHYAMPAATAPPPSATQQLQPWLHLHLPCNISQVSLVRCFVIFCYAMC